jgi:DegV family protein with EDD domain
VTVAIVTDSGAAFPAGYAARHDITVVPMRVEPGPPASTSAPPPGDFEAAIRDRIDGGADGVVVVTLASSLSASFQSAAVAGAAFDGRARVVDSRTAAGAQALVALAAAARAARDRPLAAVAETAESVARRVDLVGTVPDLSHLVRSGRVPAIAAWAGRTLRVNPLFELRDGTVRRLRPARTARAAEDRMIARVRRSRPGPAQLHTVALHADAPDAAAALLRRVEAELGPATALLSEFGPVMEVHTGPGVLGIAWWWEEVADRDA